MPDQTTAETGLSPEEIRATAGVALGQRETRASSRLPENQRRVFELTSVQIRANHGRGALEALSEERMAGFRGFSQDNWAELTKGVMQTGFDQDGKRIALPEDMGKINEARTLMDAYIDYTQHGIDGLTGTNLQKQAKREILGRTVADFIRATPLLAESVSSYGGQIPQEAISSVLKDVKTRMALTDELNRVYDVKKPEDQADANSGILDKIHADGTALATAKAALATAQTAKANAEARLAQELAVANPDQEQRNRIEVSRTEVARQQAEIIKNQVAMDNAALKVKSEAGRFSADIKNALSRAAQKCTAERAKDYIDKYRATKEGLQKTAVTDYEKKFDDALKNRWINHSDRTLLHFWGPVTTINKGLARRDVNTMLGRGPDEVIRETLRRTGASEAQIELMMQDRAFIEKKRTEVFDKLMAVHVASGGKLSNGQIEAIANAGWGESAGNIFTNSEAYKKVIQDLHAKGIKNVTPADVLKKGGNKTRKVFVTALVAPLNFLKWSGGKIFRRKGSAPAA